MLLRIFILFRLPLLRCSFGGKEINQVTLAAGVRAMFIERHAISTGVPIINVYLFKNWVEIGKLVFRHIVEMF
jgi:hypothetical protein